MESESIYLIGIIITILSGIIIYNNRLIADLKTKVDFIYENIKVTMEFIKKNGGKK